MNELAERWVDGFPDSVGWFLRQSGPEMEVHFRRLIDAVDTLSGDQGLHQQALTLWNASHASRAEHGAVSP